MTLVVGFAPDGRGHAVLHLAAMLARSGGEELVVCAVVPEAWPPSPARVDAEYQQFVAGAAENALSRARARMAPDVSASYRVLHARSTASGLLDVSSEVGASLIVLGSAADGGSGMVSLGSVNSRLLHSSHVPVVLAPRGFRTAPGQRVERVTAAFGGAQATAPVSVSAATLDAIAATPNPLVVQRNVTKQLAVTGTYSDLSTSDLTANASFVSQDPLVATVSPSGAVTAVAAGTTTIAINANGKQTAVAVTVTPAVLVSLTIAGGDLGLPKGLCLPLVVFGTYSDLAVVDVTNTATFTVGDAGVATVSNVAGSIGLLCAIAQGHTTVTAHVGAITATVNVDISNALLTGIEVDASIDQLLVLQVVAFTALGHYTDGSTQDLTSLVGWSSASPGILSISNLSGLKGRAIALALGSTTVTASLGTVLGTKPITIGSGCHAVINEVTTGTLANSKDEFVELYNPCSVPFQLDGETLAYRTATGTTDTVLANLAGTLPAGSYLVYGNSGFTGAKDGSFTGDLPQLGGGLAIRNATSVIDSVGYGVALDAYVEGVAAPAAPLGQAIARVPNGIDTNNNAADFRIQAATPHAAN